MFASWENASVIKSLPDLLKESLTDQTVRLAPEGSSMHRLAIVSVTCFEDNWNQREACQRNEGCVQERVSSGFNKL